MSSSHPTAKCNHDPNFSSSSLTLLFTFNQSSDCDFFFQIRLLFLYTDFTALVPVSRNPHSLQFLFQVGINNKAYFLLPIPSWCPPKVLKGGNPTVSVSSRCVGLSLYSDRRLNWHFMGKADRHACVYLICLVFCLAYYFKCFWHLGSQHPFSSLVTAWLLLW